MRKDGDAYVPSNGTEFEGFYDRWCMRCANDDPEAGDICEIVAKSMFGKSTPEWTWRGCRPHCADFISFDGMQPKPEQRCPHTLELFA